MNNQAKKTLLVSLAFVGLSLAVGPAMAQTVASATAIWNPPTYGTPVDHYVLQRSIDDGPWLDVGTTSATEYDLEVEIGSTHRVRIAAVDAEGRQGEFSVPSNSYNPSGTSEAPGKPGRPELVTG